jgi:hypothetical protein
MKNLKELFAEGTLESEQELNDRIVKITNTIQEKYPELVPYLSEMPVTVPNDPDTEVNYKILRDYYDSLYQIVINHEKNKPETSE